ncbi:MAG: HEPN domain-containing protein [Thermodesulfovibrionales bacterium]
MVEKIKTEKEIYIKGALEISREKIEAVIDAYKRGNYGQVLSSMYYAYFHIIKALLYKKGFDPKSHEGVYTMMNLHFIKSGILNKKFSRFFERLHKNREIADYNPVAPKFDKKDADMFINEFAELTPEILRLLNNFRTQRNKIMENIKLLKNL